MQPRLLELYRKEVVAKLSQEFGYKNVHQVPRLKKTPSASTRLHQTA